MPEALASKSLMWLETFDQPDVRLPHGVIGPAGSAGTGRRRRSAALQHRRALRGSLTGRVGHSGYGTTTP